MIKDDPTIERIRQTRHAISEKFSHDPKKLIEYYIELQKRHKDRFISLPEIRKETEETALRT